MEQLQRNNHDNHEQTRMETGQIIRYVLRRIWIVIFAGVLGMLCALIYTKINTTPTYTSSTKMYILEKGESSTGINGGNLQLGATIAGDYAQLIKDREVAESVIADYNLNYSAAELISRISVSVPNSGRILTISVTDADPYLACKLATAVRDAAAIHIKEVMNSDAINVVEEAEIPLGSANYNYKVNGTAGFLLGAAVAIGIIFLLYMMNDTIKTAEDVERYLGLSVLGTIPLLQGESRKDENEHESKEVSVYGPSGN